VVAVAGRGVVVPPAAGGVPHLQGFDLRPDLPRPADVLEVPPANSFCNQARNMIVTSFESDVSGVLG
jgi:hypothetical protein